MMTVAKAAARMATSHNGFFFVNKHIEAIAMDTEKSGSDGPNFFPKAAAASRSSS